MHQLDAMFQASATGAEYAGRYFARLSELMKTIDCEALGRAIDVFQTAREEGRTIFFIANGGSAAVASHFVNDLIAGAAIEGAPPFRALSLTDNVESLTAIANDSGFERIFSVQLASLMRPKDVIVAFSVSGNSPNIVRGMEYAREHGARTIGFCGFDGGEIKEMCDVVVHIPTTRDEYGPVEDFFSLFDHVISGYLSMKRGKRLHH